MKIRRGKDGDLLSRRVSLSELADIRRTLQLRSAPGSCESKHMATTVIDSAQWGEALHGIGNFAIIRITIDDTAAAAFMLCDNLYFIGPALFPPLEELE